MARVVKGGSNDQKVVMQPDRSIVEKNDGTLEGTVIFKQGEAPTVTRFTPSGNQITTGGGTGEDPYRDFPDIDDPHPDDDRLECYNLAYTHNANGYITCQASYFGVVPGQYQVTHNIGSDSAPIETHPNFGSLAGTASSPKNDAAFDDETGEFLNFTEGQFAGLQYYLTPSNNLSITYWLDTAPNLQALMSVWRDPLTLNDQRDNTSGIVLPTNVISWLLVSVPTRKVGKFWQVTEQWLGSGSNRGWNVQIYPNQQVVEPVEE